jgi:hypothetical protein
MADISDANASLPTVASPNARRGELHALRDVPDFSLALHGRNATENVSPRLRSPWSKRLPTRCVVDSLVDMIQES